MFTTEQRVALCGAHLIKELAYRRSFVPSCTEKDNHREGMALLVRTLKQPWEPFSDDDAFLTGEVFI